MAGTLPPAVPPLQESDDVQYLDDLPAVPPHGTAAVPVSVLWEWRDRINAAKAEHNNARIALFLAESQVQAANLRIKIEDERHRVARKNYLELDVQYSDALLTDPLQGTASAPPSDLLAWRNEIRAAEAARDFARKALSVAESEVQLANSCIKTAGELHRAARRTYLELMAWV